MCEQNLKNQSLLHIVELVLDQHVISRSAKGPKLKKFQKSKTRGLPRANESLGIGS